MDEKEVYESSDPLRRMVAHREAGKVEAKDNYKRQSRERLRKNVESKIRTTMIGSLSQVEQLFGFLWGHGKPKNQLTDQELQMDSLKDQLRTAILNQGNSQLRAANAEIAQYDVEWKRYHYDLASQGENNQDEIDKVYGINEDGSRKKLRDE